MSILIVHDQGKRFPLAIPSVETVDARTYLSEPDYTNRRGAKVFNLCRSYRYQTTGYYISLLAEARGHHPLPSIATIQDLRVQPVIRVASQELDGLIQHALKSLRSTRFELSIYFGKNLASKYDRLSLAIFNQFPAPFLRATFRKNEDDDAWSLESVRLIGTKDIPEEHYDFVLEQALHYFEKPRRKRAKQHSRYDLAILVDPDNPLPPSNKRALVRFMNAAESLDMRADVIGRDAYGRLSEYDALFIRETTLVNHYTFRFARRAAAQGLVVIDDPDSILRCTNKVYLKELLQHHRIRTPKTEVISKESVSLVEERIGFPCVIKQPDGSFSTGVRKFESRDALEAGLPALFETSELLIAQEFVPTEFDWRVGILNGEPLYVCRYYMARKHWQIVKHGKNGVTSGDVDTLPLDEAPKGVVDLALRTAKLIGDGLYGVDVKEVRGKPVIIEINDNPNIDAGYEDRVVGKELYRTIMQTFVDRITARRNGREEGVRRG